MKQILIVSATSKELSPFLTHFNQKTELEEGLIEFAREGKQINVLITGIGMVNTAFTLGQLNQKHYDLAINAGIAGTFDSQINIGECVLVMQDELSEMGAEDGEQFIKYGDMQLGGSSIFYAKYNDQFSALQHLKKVNGISVNKVHGHEPSIQKTKHLFNPSVESMEGAAFYRAAGDLADVVIQLRSISNRVEKRNREAWQIPNAISQLNQILIQLIESIS